MMLVHAPVRCAVQISPHQLGGSLKHGAESVSGSVRAILSGRGQRSSIIGCIKVVDMEGKGASRSTGENLLVILQHDDKGV